MGKIQVEASIETERIEKIPRMRRRTFIKSKRCKSRKRSRK